MYENEIVICILNLLVTAQCSSSGERSPFSADLEEEATWKNPCDAIAQYIMEARTLKYVTIASKGYSVVDVISHGDCDVPAHLLLKSGEQQLSARLFATDREKGNALAKYEANVLMRIGDEFHNVFPKFIEMAPMKNFMVIVTSYLGNALDKLSEEHTFVPVNQDSVHHDIMFNMILALQGLDKIKLAHNNISPRSIGWIQKKHRAASEPLKLYGFKQTHEEGRLFSPWHDCVVPRRTDEWYGGLTLLTVALKNTENSVCVLAQKMGSILTHVMRK